MTIVPKLRRSLHVLATTLSVAGLSLGTAEAAPKLRFQTDQRGDIVLLGNSTGWKCAQGVPAPTVGTVNQCPAQVSGNQVDILWQSDLPQPGQALADVNTTPLQARTTAVLALPQGAAITYARIYWSAARTAGGAGSQLLLERPGTLSQVVTADDSAVLTGEGPGLLYQSTADVTAAVQKAGAGALRVSGIDAVSPVNLGKINYVVWSLAVFYSLPTDPPRTLSLLDGLAVVDRNNPLDFKLAGFLPLPQSAGFVARIGVVAYDGDATLTGDSLMFNGQTLGDQYNPANNFFNSTRVKLGQPVSVAGDLPQLRGVPNSMGSVDLDEMDVTPLIPQGSTSATIEAASIDKDVFFWGVLYGSVATLKPVFSDTRLSVLDETNPVGAVRPGDLLDLLLDTSNTGSDGSLGTVVTLPLPPGLTYVPGSIQVLGDAGSGPRSDQAGDDQAAYDPATRTVTVRLGQGASSTAGGSVPAGSAPIRIRLQATVDMDQADHTLPLQGQITAAGQAASKQGIPATTWSTGTTVSPAQPLLIPVQVCQTSADCPADKPVCRSVMAGQGPRCAAGCTANPDCAGVLAGQACLPAKQICGCQSGADCPSGQCDSAAGACVVPAADLSVQVTVQPQPPVAGLPVLHVITVSNAGPGTAPASTVVVTYQVPPGGTITTVEAPGWQCMNLGRTITCTDLGALPPGSAPQIRVTVVPPQSAPEVDVVAAVRGTATQDPQPGNNHVVTSVLLVPGPGPGGLIQLAGGGCAVSPMGPGAAGAAGVIAMVFGLLGLLRRRRG